MSATVTSLLLDGGDPGQASCVACVAVMEHADLEQAEWDA